MKHIKFNLWLLFAICALTGISGCQKFLDRQPLKATLDDLNTGKLEAQVLNMYSQMRSAGAFATLPWVDFHSIRGDDAAKGSDINDGGEVVTEFDTYQYSKDDWAPNDYWNGHYTMINTTNNAIATYIEDSIANPGVTIQPATYRNIGEACFFRAFAYFDLVKTYGDVPLFNFPLITPADGLVDRTPSARIYEFIDSNLAVAAALCPMSSDEYGSKYPGRITRGAANTLWAQTYLFRKQWDKVVALTNEVIASGKYSLLPEFSDIWKDGLGGEGKNSAESIFEAQATVGQGGASNESVRFGSAWGTCQQVRQNGASSDWNLGWGWNVPTESLVADWPDDDPRKSKTILYSGEFDGGPELGGHGLTIPEYTNPDGTGGLAQKYWNKKLYTGNSPAMLSFTGYTRLPDGASWINHRILRYADVILMLAEASNELGDGGTAEANLELIRDRASGGEGEARTIVPKIAFVDQEQ
ncbi:MAG TPA: RagB/SusD family nutrient uptake outer membrane protein, partial [Flavitalea sp.]|nr:RagB/SusD family nutrient uptake outer membrane protein [Flavitalea sp.]